MQIIKWPRFLESGLPLGEKSSSMTIGVFDGVHLGHQALIQRVVSHDSRNVPVAITFIRNHKTDCGGREYPGNIQSFRQKTEMFERLGLEITLAVEFTESFRQMTGNEFMRILFEHCKMGFLAVGRDFRCGYCLDTDAPAIQNYFTPHNVPVEIVEDVMEGSKPVSSSRIRDAIALGELKQAQAMLGYPYTLDLGGQGVVLPPQGKYRVLLREKSQDRGTAAEILIEKGAVRIPDKPVARWKYAEFTPC